MAELPCPRPSRLGCLAASQRRARVWELSGEEGGAVDAANPWRAGLGTMRTLYVLVTGSRTWKNVGQLRATLDDAARQYGRIVLFHGSCGTGADNRAEEWAITYARPVVEPRRFPAELHGKWPACGPIRNSFMVARFVEESRGHERRVFAFRSRGKSNGTDDCAVKCRRAGLVVEHVHEDP